MKLISKVLTPIQPLSHMV